MENIKSKFHYGWVVAIGCFMVCFCIMGIGSGTNAMFNVPIIEELGVTRTDYMMVYAYNSLVATILCYFFPFFQRLLGARKIVAIGGIAFAGAYLNAYFATTLWQYTITQILIGVGVACCFAPVYSAIIDAWYIKNKGTIIGLCSAGSGWGPSLFILIANYVVAKSGLHAAFLTNAIMLLVLTAITVFILRDHPSEKGLLPIGYDREPKTEDEKMAKALAEEAPMKLGVIFKQLFQSPKVWVGFLIVFLLGFTLHPMVSSATTILVVKGFDSSFAAVMLSLIYFFIAIGKIVVGWVRDHIGIKWALVITFLPCLIADLILMMMPDGSSFGAYAFAVLFGFAASGSQVASALTAMQAVGGGGQRFYALSGLYIGVVTTVPVFLVPLIANMYDRIGNYNTAITMLILGCAAGIVLSFVFDKLKPFLSGKQINKPATVA